MHYLDLSFSTPEENLACDEALLDQCEDQADCEILRVWEPQRYFVVLGYANRASLEVKIDVCREKKIPLLRRCSGGGTVLQGPGCLNYSLILQTHRIGALETISGANAYIMRAQQQALAPLLNREVEIRGHTDLAVGGLKFSGNAQRRKHRCLLFHGTFLLDFNLALMEETLEIPLKQPSYRRRRSHAEFLTNLALPPPALKDALKKRWTARETPIRVPREAIERLVQEKYSQDAWTFKFG